MWSEKSVNRPIVVAFLRILASVFEHSDVRCFSPSRMEMVWACVVVDCSKYQLACVSHVSSMCEFLGAGVAFKAAPSQLGFSSG